MTPAISPITADVPTTTSCAKVAAGANKFQSEQRGMQPYVALGPKSSHRKFSRHMGHCKGSGVTSTTAIFTEIC